MHRVQRLGDIVEIIGILPPIAIAAAEKDTREIV